MKRIGRKGLFVFGLMIVTGLVASGSFFSALLPNKKKTMRISNLTIVHILPLTWSRADKPPYSALISGFEHLLGINMEKTDFQRHFSILSPELCFFSWIRAEIRIKYAFQTRIEILYRR